jgi:hypothetical protein
MSHWNTLILMNEGMDHSISPTFTIRFPKFWKPDHSLNDKQQKNSLQNIKDQPDRRNDG